MASGEMSSPGFTGFLEAVMSRAIQFGQRASIHYWFIDLRPDRFRRSNSPLFEPFISRAFAVSLTFSPFFDLLDEQRCLSFGSLRQIRPLT